MTKYKLLTKWFYMKDIMTFSINNRKNSKNTITNQLRNTKEIFLFKQTCKEYLYIYLKPENILNKFKDCSITNNFK